MTSVGPVCHIPPDTVIDQPGPIALPSIPPAQPNLQSLMNTVNQMRLVINYLSGRQGPQGPKGKSGDNAKAKPARWTEAGRVVEIERVYQNNDRSSPNYIDVQRINQLRMRDGVTGESWTWDRGRK